MKRLHQKGLSWFPLLIIIAGVLIAVVVVIYTKKGKTTSQPYRRPDDPTQTRSFVSPGVAGKDYPISELNEKRKHSLLPMAGRTMTRTTSTATATK